MIYCDYVVQCTVSLTFAENIQVIRTNSPAILPIEPLKAFISKIKVIFNTSDEFILIAAF